MFFCWISKLNQTKLNQTNQSKPKTIYFGSLFKPSIQTYVPSCIALSALAVWLYGLYVLMKSFGAWRGLARAWSMNIHIVAFGQQTTLANAHRIVPILASVLNWIPFRISNHCSLLFILKYSVAFLHILLRMSNLKRSIYSILVLYYSFSGLTHS